MFSFLAGLAAVFLVMQTNGGVFGAVDECDANRLGQAFGPLSTIYRVDDGELNGICHGTDDPTVFDAWSQLTLFTTAEERTPLAGFAGFRNTSSQDVLAYATALDRDQSKYMIVVNLDMLELDPWQVRRTIAHEFAHVITRSAQGVGSDGCGSFGCVSSTNYMALWVDRFWSAEEQQQLEENGFRNASEARRRCAADSSFPTEYAATNPYEDFSESMEFFLFSNTVPSSVQPRIQFLSSFPELVRMRDRITTAGLADTRRFLQNCGI